MDKQLAKTLYRWAKDNATNRASLATWLDAAIAAIADGKGNQIVASSGNGVSVTFSATLTYTAWANTLSAALDFLDRGTSTSRTVGRLA